MELLKISPKGQITIPQKVRNLFKHNKVAFEIKGTTITLRPIKIEVVHDETEDFFALAEKAYDFWNNSEDDVYDEFYNQKKK